MESFGGSVASDTVASLAMIGLEGRGEGLSVLHQRLEGHFTALRSHRDQAADAGVPLFALEHGLDDGQLSLLKLTVAEAVQRQYLSPSAWLPYVVYAAEIGYEYCGDEYWQTFASRTPGWPDDNGSRDFIRSSFRKFAQQFGGARPSGAWAGHFRIICWPITHAVLPTDLQRHLAQLLHDYRMALTSELLADPPKLGARLATRTLSFSSRFQNFAQNAPLLGQVAAALYLGTEEESPYLLTSTLTRIVETLSSQREAKLWLRDARRSASTVRARGFVKPASPKQTAADSRGSTPVRLPNPTDPEIVLHGSDLGWQTHLRLPDLSALAGRLPELHQLLTRRRVRVTGRSGTPLAHRRLLVPGQEVRLDEWPNWRAPLLQFEGDRVDAANRLLDEQCQLSPGPIVVVAAGMVFRIALDLPIEPDVSLSLWTFESTDRPTGPTALERLDLGRVWLVGAGAVGSCLAWWLMFVGIDGHWTVIDLDVVKALNLDRSLPFFASHTSDFGVRACSKADVVSSILVGSDAFPHAWDDWTRTDPHSPDVLFLAANEGGVRPSVAAYSHPATLGATTSPHWTAELHRHLIGRDGCATCRFPEKAPKFECATSAVAGTPPPGPALPTDASLPFLAGGAGLLGLAGLLQLNEGRFVSHDANHWTLAFDPADDLMRMRRWPHWPSCHAIADPSIRRALHGATRYQALDPEL